MSVVFLAITAYALSLGPIDCNPVGATTVYDSSSNACYTLKAACKGGSLDTQCVSAVLNEPNSSLTSDCGGKDCNVDSDSKSSTVRGNSVKASCKWSDGASIKASAKRLDDSLCKPCCLRPLKTGCTGVCP